MALGRALEVSSVLTRSGSSLELSALIHAHMTNDPNAFFTAGEYRDLSRLAGDEEMPIEQFFWFVQNRPAARHWLGEQEARAQREYDRQREEGEIEVA